MSSDALSDYLQRHGKHDLLSADEERELVIRFHRGDKSAGDRLIACNQRFVVKLALEHRRDSVEIEDLIQEANLGMLVALRKFDPNRGVRFLSFARWWMAVLMRLLVVRSSTPASIGKSNRQMALFYGLTAERSRRAADGEDTSNEALARRFLVPVADVLGMTALLGMPVSLDGAIAGDDDGSKRTVGDTVADDGERSVEDFTLDAIGAGHALEVLDDLEREIVARRYLAEPRETLQSVGDRLGMTRERVRQIEAGALARMRAALSGERVKPRPPRRRNRRRRAA
jgi:RNA polymerase sigma-32 factor